MKRKLRLILANLCAVLAVCFLIFSVLDWFNYMMNFSHNPVSAKLLVLFCIAAIALSVLVLLDDLTAKRRGDTENTKQQDQ